MSDREQLIHELDQTPDILVREVLNFLLFIKSRTNQADTQESSPNPNPVKSPLPNYLSFIDQLNSETPVESPTNLPKDFAKNLDHYLYGSAKE
ncbi:hypothetical protein [Pseudanabaena sp. ABRG5-3]|uniref:hypothetical protein n=1 Tax=Pseudanabaena sp. ABRG5-3 TaxID=685565 RepID=UPI000DC7351E|nr:hypothetical protein [Pseudanabaena sp. ABRG5-3]BBC26468.1 hypothetical protein ABRG53_4211 [Pseudanabaena sp. ABRG5-3]